MASFLSNRTMLSELFSLYKFLESKSTPLVFCTLTLIQCPLTSGDIVEWCLGSEQVKDKVEKSLCNKYVDE